MLDSVLTGGRPPRPLNQVLMEQAARRLGARLRFYAEMRNGAHDLEVNNVWATDYFDAWAQFRKFTQTQYVGWPRKMLGVNPEWDALLFPNGGILMREDFEHMLATMGFVLIPDRARLAVAP